MKNRSKLEVIGEIACDCGRVAYVEQTKRKGDFVQVRCSACGVDQRVGKTLQARWKDTMKPVGHYHDSKDVAAFGSDNVEIVPSTTPDTIPDTNDVSKNDTITEPVETAPKAEPVRREVVKPKKKSASISPLLGLGVFVVSIGGAAILSELSKGMRG